MWEWVVPSASLPDLKQRFLLSGTARRSDGVHTRLVSETQPGPGAAAANPTLEDAYLYWISSAPAAAHA